MNWDIFRAYDIRGVYPDDLDEEAYYRIAKAYTYLFRPKTMVVGMDARESSPKLKDALTSGFVDAGVNVVDIGGITTDMLYFAVGSSDYSGGIVVSASHNPRKYNGAKMVREKVAAIWDADADRCMFLDEKGNFISGAYVTALLADILLTKHGNDNKVIFDPRVIWPTIKVCEQHGAQPLISKSGHAFIKERMRKENAIFAGEMSGHYYFRENFYADNGVIPFLLVAEYLSKTGKSFSEMMQSYMEGHYMSGELNYRVDDVKKIIEAVKSKFSKEGTEDFTDGYSLETTDWRFNIRPSNTEPLLRLNIEARQDGLVDKVRAEVEEIIGSKPH